MTEICRTCLQEVGDSSVIFYLDAVDSQSETITIRCKLADCVPEMDLDVVPNAFICNSCFESLMVAHEFKNKCLETEGRIQSYIEQMGYVLTSVNLREIVQQSKLPAGAKPSTSGSDFSAFFDYSKDSSQVNRTTLYDTNKNPIDPFSIKKPKEKSLDLKNLQCDTRAFFAVPKIAQLLAEGQTTYQCSQCGYKASSDLDLKSHEEAHHQFRTCDTRDFFAAPKIAQLLTEGKETSHKCNRCTYIASSDLDLKFHEESHFVSQKFQKCDTLDVFASPKIAQLLSEGNGTSCTSHKCTQCTYMASSDLDLRSHEDSHFTQKLHKCTQCDYSAPKRQTLIIHMRKHWGEKPYHCEDCGYSTPYRNTLVEHLRTHTGEKPYKCTLCDFSSVYSSALSKHIRMHTDEKSFQCELCDYKGRLKFDLKAHMRLHTGEKPYKCLLCDYSSSHKTNLGYHMRVHSGEKPYKCKMCDYKSSQKINLYNHVRSHTGEKLLKCTHCNYCTAHSKSLTTHMRIHTGDKLYSCTFCNYSSSAKINLIKHIMIHTEEKPFQCFDCGYNTVTKTDLERHMSVHSTGKPFVCSTCHKTFGNVKNLRRHMKHHTKEALNKLMESTTDPTIDATTRISTGASEKESDSSETHVSTEYQINRDKNNHESAVKKEMII